MTTITKERIELFIKNPLDNGLTRGEQMEVARIALASLETKPIGAFHIAEQQVDGTSDYIKDGEWPIDNGTIEVYAAPPVPVIQADVAQAIENLKQKLVECNRYNYCADAVKGVEDACRAVSYSQADNQPASGNQAAESNRGNEWTGNPDIDNAIIMLDRIDTLENCDDDRIEAVKAVLRRLAGNSPVTPDSWINCSERMPEDTKMLLAFSQGEIVAAYWNWVVNPIDYKRYRAFTYLSGNILDDVTHWMPLPEPPL
ncbi:TPA: DUF551 domain-containing protein [Escherichia coli]|nr:DUF551 domain-containing protein [Escherichia coli]MBE1744833.1 DUF551 domain-containing protein [Escherichia coli]QLR33959.1 DUF551 domain-containing protein [Escherichia coli]HDK0238754.1 DUF551 domain-containing protein [Escherichia coli]